ncbi:DUF4252 domain-containing protein [Dysgonomonas sp. Marseille-P4361]|uniref:DUF4252 domain-containing protein n=1 Tax=Dysgonomonas sp. Marseille-P4361 TaxID=2161820 RepID=UPI000D54E25F|nr:DUF4252 domain-containing protein [Dysgonomonas sp. Marseille-P4361]
MKKFLICLVLISFVSLSGYSQGVDNLLKKASSDRNVEKVKVDGFMMFLGKMLGGMSDKPVMKGIKSVEVFELSDGDAKLKSDFFNLFNNTKNEKGYETLIFVKDKEDGIRILMKKEKDIIKDLVLLCKDEKEPVIIRFTGKIKEQDIDKLVNQYNNK